MASKITGSISIGELEARLCNTKQFKYVSQMDKLITEMIISQNKENIAMPTLLYFSQQCPEYRQEMLNLYNGTFGLFDQVNVIPDDIKVLQASVIDSFCYGYNTEKNSVAVYTLNTDLFRKDNILDDKFLKKVIEDNAIGRIKALRYDYKYKTTGSDAEDSVDWGLTAHRTVIDDEGVCLVPFLAGVRFLGLIRMFLSRKSVFMIRQEYASGESVYYKSRCITEEKPVLAKYCDVPDVVYTLESKYYPLDAYFYAPVIGAPSTTAGVTNINLFRIVEMRMVKSTSELKQYGVVKAKDPITLDIVEKAISSYISELSEGDLDEYDAFINACPKAVECGLDDANNARDAAISAYIHSLTNAERNKVFSLLPLDRRKAAKAEREIYKEVRWATEDEVNNLEQTLKTKICKILIKKEDSRFSSITCTNNKDVLKAVYGDDYFNKYESLGVRARYAINEMNGENVEAMVSALKKYEIGVDAVELINYVLEKYKKLTDDTVMTGIYELKGKKQYAKLDNDMIFTRTLTAKRTAEGSVYEYYKDIDTSKIVRVLILN